MIRVYDDTKVFVQCPAGACTGGAELLHQIVSFLRDKGLDAYIVYFGEGDKSLPSDYSKYNIEIAEAVSNEPHDISVLYEATMYQVAENTKIQKILWWLSVDNYFTSGRDVALIDLFDFNIKMGLKTLVRRAGKFLIKGRNDFSKSVSLHSMSKKDVVCCYQSEYAHHFLLNNGFREMLPLKDYINTDHIKPVNKLGRENIVLYNPKKGFEFTRKLIAQSPDIDWRPIQGMTRSQLISLMAKSKVYIDFGNHPGKDRLPRECAMNGLCVITGSRGSARYFEDVWLENKYKFDEHKAKKEDIISRIREVLKNYENAIDDFAFYRHRIALEKEEFENQLAELFKLESNINE